MEEAEKAFVMETGESQLGGALVVWMSQGLQGDWDYQHFSGGEQGCYLSIIKCIHRAVPRELPLYGSPTARLRKR